MPWFSVRAVGIVAAGLSLAWSGAAVAQTDVTAGPLSIASQGSFFVGGRDVKSDTLSTLPAYAASGTITVDQMYVQYQVPSAAGAHVPLTLIHGCCLTGKTWETTPDGRMGWDEYFLRKGYPVYVIDQVWRGRSAASPAAINAVKTNKAPADQLPVVFSAGREGAWAIFRFGPEYPKVFDGLQFPIEAQDEFWKQMVPDWSANLATPNPTVPALSLLAQKLGSTVLVSHSQSGIYPFQTAVLSRQGIAGSSPSNPEPARRRRTIWHRIRGCLFWCCGATMSASSPVGRLVWWVVATSCRPPTRRAAGRRCWCCGSRHPWQFAHADAGQEQPTDCRSAGGLGGEARRQALIGSGSRRV